jgi:NADH dehydrogenase
MIQARLLELAPQPLMSRDNLRSMRVDNVTTGEPLPFGLQPTALEAVVPSWLGQDTVRASYYPLRRYARR